MGLDELVDMSRVIRKTLLIQLASIETIHKELQSRFQGFWAARKTARAACQTRQVMAQFGIVAFDRVGIRFTLRDFIITPVIPQAIIDIKGIAIVAPGFGCLIHHLLGSLLSSFPDDLEAEIATGNPIYNRKDVDLVFFSPMKVKSSSISASLTSPGTGGSGNWAARALTHKETVRW